MPNSKALLVLVSTWFVLGFPQTASSQDCFSSTIMSPSPFMGNNDEIFRLADGSVWQVKYEYEYMYEYYPSVVVCPSRGTLIVGKKTLNVQPLSRPVTPAVPTRPTATGSVIESKIDGEFNGWDGETIFKLRNGQIWQQSSYSYEYHYAYSPSVLIYKSGSGYKMRVEGVDGEIQVTRLSSVIESKIDGEFNGWDGETIFKLRNGQIWQQSSYSYEYHYAYSPNVLVYKSGSGYKMRVEGVDGEIQVTRLK